MAQFITDTLAAHGKKQDGGKAQYITDALASGASGASGVPAASNSTIKDPVSYALANVGLGIAGIFEGAGDLIVGTAAQLTGNKAYAEYLHKKNVTGEWRGALDSVYKPGRAMTFVGDVGQGIGQSSAFLLDAVAPGVGTSLFFGGVAGRGVSEASQITGELGAKEYVYGAAAGAVEGLLEKYVGAGGQLVGNLTGKVGGNITRGIVSKIAKETAGQAVSKGIIKGMISAGAGEFAEEFLSEYANTFLQRATGVDKNAEYSLGNAVYSGMVGFASGAFLGGAAKSINTAVSYNSGKRVIDGGNADTLVKTAKVVGDSFESDGGKGMPEALTLLKKSVEKYGDIKDKSGAAAAVTLGEIKAYLAMTETYAGVREVMATLDKASDSAVAEYAKYMSDFTGKAVSAEDFRSDKDNVKSDYAVQAWASLFLSDSKAEAASRRFNDIIAADTEGRANGAPVVQELSVSEWQGGDAVFSLPGGEYVNIMTAEDGLYSLSWGRTADDVHGFTSKTAEQVRDILAKIKSGVPQTAAGSTQDAQGVGGAAGQATAQTVAGQAQGGAQGIYTAQVQDAARAAVKDFDTLSPGVRRAVMDWVRSADGVDGDIVSSVGFIMSVRPGLQVLYAKLGDGHRGLYANLPDIDRRLIVASGDASAVRETLAHELAHDMRLSVGWNALRDAAMEAAGEGEMAKIAELYRDALGLDAAAIDEEIVTKTVGKMLTDRKFLERYAETGNIRKITRAARSLFEYIASRGADRVTLAQSARIMRIMDGIIAIDYVMGLAKGKAESDSNAAEQNAAEQNPTADPDIRYDLDETDRRYMSAVESGDTETAQKMVDEAARKAGYTIKAYHGTNAKFNTFRFNPEDLGIHAGTKSQARAKSGYGKNAVLLNVAYKLNNPIKFDKDYGAWDSEYIAPELVKTGIITKEEADYILLTDSKKYKRNIRDGTAMLREMLIDKGYDGFQYPNWYEGKLVKTSYAVFKRDNIKSADPVTYDDAGSVIPLSKRFATDIPDIRYDLDMKAKANDKQISELQKLADKYKEQAEYWKKQTKRTTEPSVEEKAVAAKARELRRRYNSRAKDTKALLQQLYDTMAEQSQTGSLNADELYAKAHAIADGILSESYERSVEYEIFSGIRSYVLGNKLKVSDAIKGDFDNWADWMRNNVPFVVSNKGVEVDAAYAELSEIYGEKYFPAEIEVPAERLRRIAEMTAYSKDKMLPAEFEDIRQEARMLALNILDDFLVMPYKKPTFADKQAGKLEMVKSAARVSADADRVRSVITKRKTRGILGNEEYNAVLTAARRIKPRFEIIPGNARAFADAFVTFLERHAPEVVSAARSEAQSVHEAYNNGKDSNQILQYIDPYTVRELLKIKSGEGALTAREMRGLHSALTALLAMDGRVDKMYKDGKWVDVAPRSARVMDYLRDHYGGRVTATQAREIGKLFTTAVMNTLDPEDVTRIAEGVLSEGTLGDAIHELKLSDERASRLYDRYTERTEAFMRENKEFTKSYHNDKVELTYTRKGADGEIIYNQTMPLTKGEAMQLYMTAKREQAKLALAMGRVRFSDNKRSGAQWRARIIGAIDGKWYEGLTDAEFSENVERMAGDIERAVSGLSEQFTKQDREFIEIMEDYYNRLSRNDKQATDDILWGKTNVVDGYYVPISRSEMARDVDLIEPRTQDMTVRNLPFNKDTVKGASAQLVIRDAYDVMKRHAKQMSRYVHMTIPLMNFQRLYNHRSDTATDNVFSIREYISTYGWAGYERYITDYFQDAQGFRKANEGEINKALRFIKSNTAKFYIGANIGSMAKQMSSVLMMLSVVGRDAWVRGMKPIHADKIDTYSVAAANRNSESAMYFAQGVGGTLGKVGNITMKPMKWGDRAAVQIMWSMVQHEVAIKEGLALGTEENFKRAGSMLDDAILLVQDTGAATTKTGVARHQQEIVSAFSMFRSAPSKMFSRLYLAGAEVAEVAKRKKAGRSVPEAAVGRASKRLAVIGSAVLTVALYESVVGLIRNAVRGKDDEEDVLKTLSGETALNLVGLVPVAGQIAENWLTGYDVSLFHLDLFNDTRKALDGVMTISDRAVSGEYVDDETIRRNARNVVYAFGRLTGIPTRNIHNIFMSALSPSKSAQYKANALFSDTGMTSALQKAIEGGDEKLARTVIDTLYNKRTGSYNTVLSNKIADLYSKGYTNVLAIKLPTVYKDADGAEVKVSARQYKDMESIYSQATAVLSRMVLDPRFTGMSEAAQARAISVAFRAYHNKAKSEVLGADRTQTVSLMGVADPLTLFIEGAYISSLGGDKKAQAAQARVARYDKVTQAAILYACGYKSMSIKSTLSKAVDSNTAQTLNLA